MTVNNVCTRSRCLVIPAIKKNAVIPDQLVKKLAGKTLIQRAIDNAKAVAPSHDVYVVTDSDEIRLICERNNVGAIYDPQYRITSLDIVASLLTILQDLAKQYSDLVIYRASCPLITATDIEEAYSCFLSNNSDCLVTVKSVKYRLWKESGEDIASLLFNESKEEAYIETKSLFMVKGSSLSFDPHRIKVIPYFLHERSLEIASYQDWWICEKILQSKHIAFVVAGYPEIGMGHIYRALMFAHEISDHRITFLCTAKSELAASNIIARDYKAKLQQSNTLAHDVLRLKPDLVINDFLNTDADYIQSLKKHGVKVVNFEDEGSGAAHADLVVNALYERHSKATSHVLYGYQNFCLRDEFVTATQHVYSETPQEILITFGGTDNDDFTKSTLETILPLCIAKNITISIVTGPGYAHKSLLESVVQTYNALYGDVIHFTHVTNSISQYMERADFAICSAGRTVYELTHMRVPAIVMAHHEREDMHTFARQENGFYYLGIMVPFNRPALIEAFTAMVDAKTRKELYQRQCAFDFMENKNRVVSHILSLLKES